MKNDSPTTASVRRKGEPGFIQPGTEEHNRLITASKVASILGVSRFQSAWSLWQYMKGNVPPKPAGDTPQVFLVGHAYEVALAELWKLKNPGWKLSRDEVQYVTDQYGFPAMATVDRRAMRGRARKLVELKTARSMEEFGDPDKSGEVPSDYAAQVTFQMMVANIQTAELVVMGPFFQDVTYPIEYDEKVAGWIQQECKCFWDSLAHDEPPELDDSVSSYYTARAMHPEITPDLECPVPEKLYLELSAAQAAAKEADTTLRGLKTKVLDLIGDAQYGSVNGMRVITRRPGARGTVNLVINKV